MIELRTEVTKLLKSHHPRVYFQFAPTDAKFPYVVFNFLNSFKNEQQEVFPLDVDIWDRQADTTELETIASVIWKDLNYHRHLDADIQFSIYQDTRFPPLEDDDPSIKRRKLTFQIKYFDRGGL